MNNQDRAQLVFNRANSRTLNSVALLGICLAMCIAFYYQLALGELPCPLCLLQRAGLILIGLGFMLNVRFGVRNAHYGLVLLAALATGMIATRQVLLHITPGSGVYGSALLGLHFYTWAAITAVFTVLFVAVMLMLPRREQPTSPRRVDRLGKAGIALFFILIAANLGSTLLECGYGQCADNPVVYQWMGSH
ncbi:disulfide bond formation protein B [Burkholderia ubonensis]|uniref:disulfide bond formation protein B n=1 Tax=Burkholderia ubonensis TaxID=101571 RepID=UPI000751E62D|nr:disulfide bond formation protein B [Burkholderia ubonensis]KVC71732.1 disulfide bond formation protein [Burkholderia ubonensis]